MDTPTDAPTLSLLELEAVIPLSEKPKKKDAEYAKRTKEMTVERITSLSRDTIERQFPEYIVTLSERRKGMKVKHALAIASGNIITRIARKGPEANPGP